MTLEFLKEDCAVCGIEWPKEHMRFLEDGNYCPLCYTDYAIGAHNRIHHSTKSDYDRL